jgi:hypothetical protein
MTIMTKSEFNKKYSQKADSSFVNKFLVVFSSVGIPLRFTEFTVWDNFEDAKINAQIGKDLRPIIKITEESVK